MAPKQKQKQKQPAKTPARKAAKTPAAKPAAKSNTLDLTKLDAGLDAIVAAARKRRAGLSFDAKQAGGARSPTSYSQGVELYGIGAHAGSLPEAIDSVVGNLVDRSQISPSLMVGDALMHPWEMYFQGFLDGYAVVAELTETPKRPKLIGSKGAVTQFAKAALTVADAALTGALAPAFDAMLGEYFALHGQGLRKPVAAAFVAGAKLRCLECGVELDALDGPKKERGAALPKGKAAPNQDLLGAVLANPDDDAPRLVYADYLTTANDPLGEFITLQLKVGNVAGYETRPPTKDVPDADALVKRMDALLKASRGKWFDGVKLATVSYARGFPVKARAEAVEFLENEKIDRIPLEHLGTNHWNAKLAEAALKRKKHPTLRSFWFGSGFGPKTCHVLTAPVFADAVELEAGFWDDAPIPPRTLEALAKCEFKKLEVLEASAELFAALDRASCPKLHTFRISEGWRMGPVTATRLWKQLVQLFIFRLDEVTDFTPLASAESLERFTMITGDVGEASVRQLLEVAPKSLKVLAGGFKQLEPELVKALSARFELRDAD